MLRGRRAALVLCWVVVCGPARAEVVNRIVATVDGEPITAHEVRTFAAEHRAQDRPEADIIQLLVTEKLLDLEAKALGITVKDDEVDQYIAQIKTRTNMDDERFKQALQQQGLTLDAYRAKVRADLSKQQLINREIRGRVSVTSEEIERHWKANGSRYGEGAGATVRDIFFAFGGPDGVERARAKAARVQEELRKGKDFAELARQYSEGPGADNGGLLGTFKRGEMEPEIDAAVFRMQPGEVSDVIQSSRGLHILQVDDIREGASATLDDKTKEVIRSSLYNDALEARFQEWLSRDLRERHHVEVLN